MFILKTKLPTSGNHGGSQSAQPASTAPARSEEKPHESLVRFVTPIKKSPSIKDVMAEPVSRNEKTEDKSLPEVAHVVPAPEVQKPSQQEAISTEVEISPVDKDEMDSSFEDSDSFEIEYEEVRDIDDYSENSSVDDEYEELLSVECSTNGNVDEEYLKHWNAMLDIVFAHSPSVSAPLRDKPVPIENSVVKIRVASSIQKKSIELKRRDMLQYFRNNYREDIDDIEVIVDEHAEVKTVIYDNQDRYEYMKRENQDLHDFMQILGYKLEM